MNNFAGEVYYSKYWAHPGICAEVFDFYVIRNILTCKNMLRKEMWGDTLSARDMSIYVCEHVCVIL